MSHAGLLSWSAAETGHQIDLRAIVDDALDVGVPGGRALIELGRACNQTRPDDAALRAVVAVVGEEAAVEAAAVAANFQIMNRVVDATGLPIGRRRRAEAADVIAALGLGAFPHAAH